MARVTCNVIFFIFLMSSIPIGSGFQKDDKKEIPFQWLASSSETSGVMYPTKKLQSPSAKSAVGTPVQIEEETEDNGRTKRITRHSYTTSVNGERVLIETVVEEIQKLPGDRIRAVRTTSRKDINGRLHAEQQEVQEVAPSGNDSFRITQTILLPESGGRFVERERIQQVEHRKGDDVEIDRVLYESDINGKWGATERRVSQNMMDGNRTQTNEQVYQNDVNNRMTLTEKVEVSEWVDAGGQTHQQTESYTPNLDGKFQLSSRTTIVQTTSEDGRQQTTEILERADSAKPGEGLRTVRRKVENLQSLNRNETLRQLNVTEPDLNGGWRSVHAEQSVEMK